MRRSEALGLSWGEVDFENGFIYLRKTKSGTARRVPIDEACLEVLHSLSRYLENCKGPIFVSQSGQVYREDCFLKPLKLAAKKAGLSKRIDIHSLRHSWASNKIRAGWGLKKVSMILGHADITMTSKVYSHLLDGDLKVRDDFRFDNQNVSANSKRREGKCKTMEAVMSELIESVQQIPVEFLESGNLPQALLTSMAIFFASKGNGDEMSLNATQRIETTTTLKDAFHVPVMTLGAKKHLKSSKSSSDASQIVEHAKSEKTLENLTLANQKKVVHPEGIEPPTLRFEV